MSMYQKVLILLEKIRFSCGEVSSKTLILLGKLKFFYTYRIFAVFLIEIVTTLTETVYGFEMIAFQSLLLHILLIMLQNELIKKAYL
jgi:hypothetical protein